MTKKQIPITCTGAKTVPLENLQGFQGNLKHLEQGQLDKLKRSIIKYGFSFPVFVWRDQILDGHQRVFATKELIKEGYSIREIPTVEIEARDATQAAEKLLTLNSHYARMSDDGLQDFIDTYGIDFDLISMDLMLPDIDTKVFSDIAPVSFTDEPEDNISDEKDLVVIKIEVPSLLWSEKRNEIKEMLDESLKPFKLKYQVSE